MSDNQNHHSAGQDKPETAIEATNAARSVNINAAALTEATSEINSTSLPATPAINSPIPLPPGWRTRQAKHITPEDSIKLHAVSTISPADRVGEVVHPDFASNTTAGAQSIVELARALNNDPQLIFQFVHDNIEWEPGYGSDRGPLGCLMDGMGNSFDQSSLLIALLNQAALSNSAIGTTNWILGTIQLTPSQLANWLNVASTSVAENYLTQANIPWSTVSGNSNLNVNHVWVQVVISGTTYVMDPTFKTYNRPVTIYVGGSAVTHGDTLTIDFTNPFISGGIASVSYIVQPGDTFNTIAAGLASYINTPSKWSPSYPTAIGVTATASNAPAPAQIDISCQGVNQVTCTVSTSVGATETLTVTPLSVSALQSITTYSGTSLVSDAESGTGYATDGTNYVSYMNRTQVRHDLTQTYWKNLFNWIQANCPAATIDQLLGGQAIIPVTLPFSYSTTLPYTSTTTLDTWSAIPGGTLGYRTYLTLGFYNGSTYPTMWGLSGSGPQPYTDTFAGSRLTMLFNQGSCGTGNAAAQLYLNGTAVGSAGTCIATNSSSAMQFQVSHPAYNYTQTQDTGGIFGNGIYFLGTASGALGRGQLDYHSQQFQANSASGGAFTTENIVGEQLACMWFMWASQMSKSCDLINRLTGCKTQFDHMVGLACWDTGVSAYNGNIPCIIFQSTNLSTGSMSNSANDVGVFFHGIAIEGATAGQINGILPGVSATNLLDTVNRSATVTITGSAKLDDTLTITITDSSVTGSPLAINYPVPSNTTTLYTMAAGLAIAINSNTSLQAVGIVANSSTTGPAQVNISSQSVNQTTYAVSTNTGATESLALAYNSIYKATSTNWSSGANVQNTLLANGYTSAQLAGPASFLPTPIVIGDQPSVTMGQLSGWAYEAFGTLISTGILNAVYKGPFSQPGQGTGPIPKQTPKTTPEPGDPVNISTGAFTFTKSDLSVGSQAFPYGLHFTRNYCSQQQYVNSTIGRGWTHNHAITATVGNDGLLAMGSQRALHAVGTIVDMMVITDLLSDTTLPVAKLVTMAMVDTWWMNQLMNNTVVLGFPDGVHVCLMQPDGSYTSPFDLPGTLTLSSGSYTFTTPQGVAWNFDTSGQISSIVYPSGVTISYTYTSGLLTSISNNLNRSLALSYTSGKLTSVSDGHGRSVSYTIDSNSDLTRVVDPLSQTYTYSYVQPGLLYQIFKPQNPTTPIVTNTYDTLFRVKTQANARGQVTNFYLAGSRSQMTDPVSNSTVWYFNAAGYPTRFIDALGNETDYVYDALNRAIMITRPEGNNTQNTYDSNNNMLSVTANPKPGSPASLLPIVYTFTYDSTWNKLYQLTDGRGNVTTFSYNPVTATSPSTLASMVQPAVGGSNPTTTFTYNNKGQVTQVQDPTGVVTQFSYDTTTNTEELIAVVVDPGSSPHLALTTAYGYDAIGNMTSVKNPNLNQTSLQYDGLRRLTQVTAPSPFSYVTMYSYDQNSNLLSIQRQTGGSPAWQTVSYAYSVTDKVFTVTDPAGNVTTLAYETASPTGGKDRLIESTDAMGRNYQFAYDALDRLNQVTDSTMTVTEVRTFTNNGLVNTVKNANGKTVTNAPYDGFDRSYQTIFEDGVSYSEIPNNGTGYDGNGNVLLFQTRSGGTFTQNYDALNRLSTKTMSGQPSSNEVFYTYDLSGRLTQISKGSTSLNPSDPSSGSAFSYDTAGRFYKETYPDSKAVTHVLDANGNRTQTTYPDGPFYLNRTFDQMDRLTGITLNGSPTDAVQFTYNQLSQRTGLSFSNGASVAYAPQVNGDIVSVLHNFVGSSVAFAYGFDKIHEPISMQVSDSTYLWVPGSAVTTSYTPNALNEYTAVGSASYTYNLNGCLASDGTLTYAYDYGYTPTENQLTSVSSGSIVLASFLCDPLHRQSVKTVGSSLTRYIYSGLQRLADYNASTGALDNIYVYGTGIDEPLIQAVPAVGGGFNFTFYHHDRLGSIVAQSSGSSGAENAKNTFGPFGETSSLTGTFGFTGQRFDPETGLYNYKNRYYSPVLGRFLQPDPIGYTGGDLNLYSYVSNAPQFAVDPLGLQPTQIGQGIAGLLGGGGGGGSAAGPQFYYDPNNGVFTPLNAESTSGGTGDPPSVGPGNPPGGGGGGGGTKGHPLGQGPLFDLVNGADQLVAELKAQLLKDMIATVAYSPYFYQSMTNQIQTGRNALGQYTGQTGANANANTFEDMVFKALQNLGLNPETQVRAINGAGDVRTYDDVIKIGSFIIGIEAKSANGTLSATQRAFDSAVNNGNSNNAKITSGSFAGDAINFVIKISEAGL